MFEVQEEGPENTTRQAIQRGLVFVELKEEVKNRLNLPGLVPIFKEDLDRELPGGQIPPAAFAAGIEALKLLHPEKTEYDRFLTRYYLAEGQTSLEQNELFPAQRSFRKALDLNQGELSAEAAFHLASLSGSDLDEAITLYRQSITLNPRAASPHFELALLLRERRDLPGALQEFEAAYRLEPKSANLLSEVGDTHLMADDPGRAKTAFKRASELEPENWALPVKLGLIDFNLGNFSGAITGLRKGLDLAPEELGDEFSVGLYVEGLYTLGLAYSQNGKPDQAYKVFRAVLNIAPDHQGAREALA